MTGAPVTAACKHLLINDKIISLTARGGTAPMVSASVLLVEHPVIVAVHSLDRAPEGLQAKAVSD